MYLLVGLGNPGSDYAGNRHNIGFMAVDDIHRHYSFQPFRTKFHGEVADGSISGHKIFIMKPMTYMNESGRSVAELVHFYKIETNNVIVLHDELDLSPGKIRLKQGGGLAGHNGLKSIAEHIGPDFRRVRIGIGHPGNKSRVTSHVLNNFSKIEEPLFSQLLDKMATHIALLIQGDGDEFVSQVISIITPLNQHDERN